MNFGSLELKVQNWNFCQWKSVRGSQMAWCFWMAKESPKIMKLSSLKVDMSIFNLIGHSCQLDLYTRSSEFLKLGHENWVEFWWCATNENSGNVVHSTGYEWYFFLENILNKGRIALKITIIRYLYIKIWFFKV